MVAAQRGRHTGDERTRQLDGRWVVRTAQFRGPAADLRVPVLVAGEAHCLAGPRQRLHGERAVGGRDRPGGGQQRGRRTRGGVAAQLQFAAQHGRVPGDGRVGAGRAKPVEQQARLGGLAGGPRVPGGGQQPAGGVARAVAEFGGPAQRGRGHCPVGRYACRRTLQLVGEGRVGVGGNSLLGTQLAARVRDQLHTELPPRELFAN
ncbi:acyl carrier protein, partial [Micromonospora profundi]|uniref:acyl carrier protein n=1 Tax=Micromonospora profundi TaxID=1420889 RepID=UPI0033BE6126